MQLQLFEEAAGLGGGVWQEERERDGHVAGGARQDGLEVGVLGVDHHRWTLVYDAPVVHRRGRKKAVSPWRGARVGVPRSLVFGFLHQARHHRRKGSQEAAQLVL